jgi:hypothetical protein
MTNNLILTIHSTCTACGDLLSTLIVVNDQGVYCSHACADLHAIALLLAPMN